MPRAKKPESQSGKSYGNNGDNMPTFVNVDLNEDDKAEIKKNELSAEECVSQLAALVSDGYKVSIGYDERSDAFNTVLTCSVKGIANSGLALSARAPTFSLSVSAVLYKHFHKLSEEWRTAADTARDSWK